MPAANVIQLRALLSEKFPGLRQRLDEEPPLKNFWPTGLSHIDHSLHGGLGKGALTEIVGAESGSATLLRALLQNAARQNQIVALIDGNDSLEVSQLDEAALSRLLWIRCRSAVDAMKAADLVLRDGNLPLVFVDLKINSEKELRKIPATTWYRFQRLVEETTAVCAVFTPRQMIAPAQSRITVHSRFSLAALERDAEELVAALDIQVSDTRHSAEPTEFVHTA